MESTAVKGKVVELHGKCIFCKGRKILVISNGIYRKTVPCDACKGTGKQVTKRRMK